MEQDKPLSDRIKAKAAELGFAACGIARADAAPASAERLRQWLAEVLPAFFPERMHSLHQLDIAVAGDEATCTAYFHNPMPLPDQQGDDGAGGTKVVEFGGLYHHTFFRTPEGWCIRRLHEQIVWRRGI